MKIEPDDLRSKPISYVDLFDGTDQSDCPIPCHSTGIKVVFTGDRKFKYTSQIYINFAEKIEITKIHFPKFAALDFLASLGGSMGLWLGLGMAQILEMASSIWTLSREIWSRYQVKNM